AFGGRDHGRTRRPSARIAELPAPRKPPLWPRLTQPYSLVRRAQAGRGFVRAPLADDARSWRGVELRARRPRERTPTGSSPPWLTSTVRAIFRDRGGTPHGSLRDRDPGAEPAGRGAAEGQAQAPPPRRGRGLRVGPAGRAVGGD